MYLEYQVTTETLLVGLEYKVELRLQAPKIPPDQKMGSKWLQVLGLEG